MLQYNKGRRFGSYRQRGKKRDEGSKKTTKRKETSLSIKVGDIIEITGFDCGKKCNSRYNCMGLIKGRRMEIVSMQPFKGAITVKFCGEMVSVGRKMFKKLRYKKIEE